MTRLNLGASVKPPVARSRPVWNGPQPPLDRASAGGFLAANPAYRQFLSDNRLAYGSVGGNQQLVSQVGTGVANQNVNGNRGPGSFMSPLNLGALVTRPMALTGAPGVPAATPAPARQATKEAPVFGGLGSVLGGLARVAGNSMVGAGNAAARPAAAAVANPGGAIRSAAQTIGSAASGQPTNNGPQPGTFRAANNPNNAYGGGGGIGMNIPNPALTQALMMGAQSNAMGNALSQVNDPSMRVSGPLNNVITTPGSAGAGLGQWMAQQQNAAHANIGNDPTRGGVMALSDYVNRPDGSRVLGNPNNYADATQMLGGRAPRDLSPGMGGAGTSGGSGSTSGSSAASGSSNAGGGTSPTPNSAQQMLDPLVAQYQAAMDAANASNDQRYDQGLANLAAQRSRADADLARMGQSRAQEIRDNARRAEAQGMQNLTARGLANTTNLPTMQRGVARDANRAQTALGDVMAQNRYNQDRAMTGDLNQWIYNRDDQAPSFDTLANLALGLAQAQVQPPAFDINSVLDRLGRQPSIQDLLSMLPQVPRANLQQPYAQYPYLPNINFPDQMQGSGGNDQVGGGRDFQVNGSGFNGGSPYTRPPMGDPTGGLGMALGGYGLTQALPYLNQGLGQFMQNPGSTIAGAGNGLGNLIASGVSGANGLLGQGLGYLGNAINNTIPQWFEGLGGNARFYARGIPEGL